jgi:hypothetical protein
MAKKPEKKAEKKSDKKKQHEEGELSDKQLEEASGGALDAWVTATGSKQGK